MRKTLTVAVLCAAFGFLLGRSSVTRAKPNEPTPFDLDATLTIDRPTERNAVPAGVAEAVPEYETVPLRVIRVADHERSRTTNAGGGRVWRLRTGGVTYTLAP
jgi:hypothetical protein